MSERWTEEEWLSYFERSHEEQHDYEVADDAAELLADRDAQIAKLKAEIHEVSRERHDAEEEAQVWRRVAEKLEKERDEAVGMARDVYKRLEEFGDWERHDVDPDDDELDEDTIALCLDGNNMMGAISDVREIVNRPLTWTNTKHRQQAGEGE